MKKFVVVTIFFMGSFLFGDVYYAKLEPFESYTIKSEVAGRVLFSDLSKEGRYVKNALIIKIDDKIDRIDLENSIKKLSDLMELSKLKRQNIENLKRSYLIKKRNYDRIKNLKTKSNLEKDNQLLGVIAANSSLIAAKESLISLKNQIKDIKYKISFLRDKISKKSITIKDRYIYKVGVKEGDYVAPGAMLLQSMDISKAKATIYLSYEDKENLDKRVIYIDGKRSDIKFYKVWDVADNINISSYKAEILLPRKKEFSKVVKIELR